MTNTEDVMAEHVTWRASTASGLGALVAVYTSQRNPPCPGMVTSSKKHKKHEKNTYNWIYIFCPHCSVNYKRVYNLILGNLALTSSSSFRKVRAHRIPARRGVGHRFSTSEILTSVGTKVVRELDAILHARTQSCDDDRVNVKIS
ncbi:hypothetical protein HYPSUDRAFT_947038 [Hypholoma sublateritium FD-334 SS-4]|uniref:Uncharacterized protein n=1 Tax=Hypholoma sublateritium (strain FD-334 SS-4) TaxID=945553 RepID=A0A0D2M5S5_HYPSF|nr:hypothetical protein HYPSUDRAFT_947038 [Hypholoma sublateritium FD-334 SS-4]